ncbi:hypothetical protein L596_018500 [Steinernema carpocapsae]|uniref:UPAR/Ly6 domain-containing protein n=1 Tax=Steinernema carpocapsae TaxID=34508 RepID=A0A4U5N564_STECR|nr:hypothetical protein L596_018500 [Steinernema carpocapsae]
MNLHELLVFFVAVAAGAEALRCKCSQSSAKTPCDNGICTVPSGDSACLALDHPTSGIYYACSQSRLPHGRCSEKLTKSGVTVRVCSCDDEDYCNARMWPVNDSPAVRSDSGSPIFRHVEAPASISGTPALALLSLPTLFLLLLHCW